MSKLIVSQWIIKYKDGKFVANESGFPKIDINFPYYKNDVRSNILFLQPDKEEFEKLMEHELSDYTFLQIYFNKNDTMVILGEQK